MLPSPSAPPSNIPESLLYNINAFQLPQQQEQYTAPTPSQSSPRKQDELALTLSPLSFNNNNLAYNNNNNNAIVDFRPNQLYNNLYNQQNLTSNLILDDSFVKVAKYNITSQEAANAFENWKQSLWFTPTGFKKQIGADTNKIYIPFYCFNSTYTVNFQGLVFYENGGQELTMNGSGKVSTPTETCKQQQQLQLQQQIIKQNNQCKSLERGSIRRTIAKIFLCASSMDDWKDYQDIRVFFDFNRVERMTMAEFKEKCQFQDARESSRLSHESVWASHIGKIQVEEQSNAISYLCNQEQTNTVDNVSSDVYFENTVATLFYVPFYHHSYVFDNKHYSFFIDGQSGQIFATRPEVGLGKIGDLVKGVKNYFGTYMWQEQIHRKRGAELCVEDNADVYDKSNYFILFPRSSSGLLSGSLQGWFTLRNKSNRPITFRGQKRRGYTKGNPITFQPRAERSFSYKGHWCLEVMEGDYQCLEILHIDTNSNNKHPNIGFA